MYTASRKEHDLALQTSLGVQVKYLELDITDPSSVDQFTRAIQKVHGAVNVLMNSAAAHNADNHPPEVVKVVLDTNLGGSFVSDLPVKRALSEFPG